jgi:hypothetical protein
MKTAVAPRVQVWEIKVAQIVACYAPLDQWGAGKITEEDVRRAVRKRHFDFRVHDSLPGNWPKKLLRRYHIERVACLVAHPDNAPIEIDVGCPVLNYTHDTDLLVIDGHHRLAAAMIRGDKAILVTYGGQVSEFRRLFSDAKLARAI